MTHALESSQDAIKDQTALTKEQANQVEAKFDARLLRMQKNDPQQNQDYQNDVARLDQDMQTQKDQLIQTTRNDLASLYAQIVG